MTQHGGIENRLRRLEEEAQLSQAAREKYIPLIEDLLRHSKDLSELTASVRDLTETIRPIVVKGSHGDGAAEG